MPVKPTLTGLLELTDAVQSAISAGEWLEAARLESERCTMLEQYLEQERSADGSVSHISEVLTGLNERNNRMIGEVHHHRRRLSQKVCEIDRGRRAVTAYGEITERPDRA